MKASPWRRLWQPLKVLISRATGPRVVGGFIRGDGEFLANTRVSNQAFVFARDALQVGDHVFIGHFSVLDATFGLRIGEGCQIGFFTGIFTHSSHAAIRLYGRDYVDTPHKKAYFTAPVEIGDYSFVGAHATILPGTVVGDTRRLDARLLEQHPELADSYVAWAGAMPVMPRAES